MNTDNTELKRKVKKMLEDTRIEYENELGKKFLEISKQNNDLKEKIERLEKENEKLEWETIKLNKYNNILKQIVEKICYIKIDFKEPNE